VPRALGRAVVADTGGDPSERLRVGAESRAPAVVLEAGERRQAELRIYVADELADGTCATAVGGDVEQVQAGVLRALR
jgi:hypothetical protein